jgi:hypothetical protein
MLTLLPAFLVPLAHAQAPAVASTGALRVVVADEDEVPIPGTTLELSGEALIGGVQQRETDMTGEVLFTDLPPGEYALVVTKAWFGGVTYDGILVCAARTTALAATLAPAGPICTLGCAPEIWDGTDRTRWIAQRSLPAAPGAGAVAAVLGSDPHPAGIELLGVRVASPGERAPALPWSSVDAWASGHTPDGARSMAPGGRTTTLRLRRPDGANTMALGAPTPRADAWLSHARGDVRAGFGAMQDGGRRSALAAGDFDVRRAELGIVGFASDDPDATDGLGLATLRGDRLYATVLGRAYTQEDGVVGRMSLGGGWDGRRLQAGTEIERHHAGPVAVERAAVHGMWRVDGRWAAADVGGRLDHQRRHGADEARRLDASPRVSAALTPPRTRTRLLAGLVASPGSLEPTGTDARAEVTRFVEVSHGELWAAASATDRSVRDVGRLPEAGALTWSGGAQAESRHVTGTLRAATRPADGWSSATALVGVEPGWARTELVQAMLGWRTGPEPAPVPGAEPFLDPPTGDDGRRLEAALMLAHRVEVQHGTELEVQVSGGSWLTHIDEADVAVRADGRAEATVRVLF